MRSNVDQREPQYEHPRNLAFLDGGGEMGQRIRELDWSRTSLGAIDEWPQSLQTAVSICLRSRFPIILWWGQDLTVIYNDAYSPMLGGKHPGALGQPGLSRLAWGDPEVSAVIGPMLRRVLERGEATWSEDRLLILERRGFPEECYFTWSYSPIQDEAGKVGGVFTAVTEMSEKVIGQRRLSILRDLADRSLEAKTVNETYDNATQILSQHPLDLPFFLIYSLDEDEDIARLVGSSPALNDMPRVCPDSVSLHGDTSSGWPLATVVESGSEFVISDLSQRFGSIPGGVWPEAPTRAVVLPIRRPRQSVPYGVLVLGVSPRRPFDDDYMSFLRLIADRIATAVSNVLAYQAERKRSEALAELDRAKTTFFSNVSHEFRTPLTLMLGPIEDALRESSTAPENRERLTVAHRNALRLLRLVNMLLDFSRIEADRVQASYEPTDLSVYTAELASGFRSAIERADMDLVIDCPPLSEPVFIDREMWEKIVLNLISNAFKYTLEGRISVEVSERDGRATVSVVDTGVGIPANELAHIFERFHRVQGSVGRTHEGSGIGLSLVHELVLLHGGDIGVQSTEGQGTAFTISLPFGSDHLPEDRLFVSRTPTSTSTVAGSNAYIEEALRWLPNNEEPSGIFPDLPVSSPVLTESGRWKRLEGPRARIVLADDNADMREYISRLLSQRYDVESVSNGAAALKAIRRELPSLILADVMMPELDGFELLNEIRSDEDLREVPVIMLSARAGEASQIEGLEAGADDYLIKPFSARELLARVSARIELAEMRRMARLASEREREHLFEFFTHAPAIICVVRGPDHIFELANPECLALFGTGTEIIGKSVHELLPAEFSQQFSRLLDSVYWSGEPRTGTEMELRFLRDGGERAESRYFNYACVLLQDEQDFTQRILLHAVDVSDQVRARQRVEEQNRVLELVTRGDSLSNALGLLARSVEKLLSGGSRAAVMLVDDDGLHLRYAAAPNLPQRFIEATDGLAVGPGSGDCGTAAFTGCPVYVSDTLADPLWSDFRDLARAYRLRSSWSTPILNSSGGVVGIFALYFDETRAPTDDDQLLLDFAVRTTALLFEREQAEETRARLAAIVESSDDAIVSKDLDGVILTWNRGAERLFGYSSDEAVRHPFTMIIPEDRQQEEIEILSRIRRGEPIDHFETVRRRKDGSMLEVSLTVSPILDRGGSVIGVSTIVHDITERKAVERQKDIFLGIAAHELRTPVAGIKGYAQLAARRLQRIGDDAAAEPLRRLDTQVDRLMRLIDDLLNVTRIESNNLLLRRSRFVLDDLITDVANEIQMISDQHRIDLDLNAPVTIEADRDRIEQVVMNLLTNAVKFSPKSDLVRVCSSHDSKNIFVSVQDFGVGIPAELHTNVFERFYQAEGRDTLGSSGLGLGLYISSEFVKRHHGRIWVEKSDGAGTTVTFALPLREAEVSSEIS